MSSVDPDQFAVAYLACQIELSGNKTLSRWRNQPLKVPAGTNVIPVIRLDINHRLPAAFSEQQLTKVADIVVKSASARGAVMVQIDFDALESERPFYRQLINTVRSQLPKNMPLSITALTSWCLFDNWIKDLPVQETVPMMFSLGRDREKVLLHFRSGGDFFDERAKKSLGLSLEDSEVNQLMIPLTKSRKIPIRVYVFTRTAWTKEKLKSVHSLLEHL